MPDQFTPEQISQILEEFFRVVGTRQYIGARYVPIFGRKDEDTIEWDNTKPYEPLTIVLYQGNSYTSRQYVPVGVEITNQEFWAVTGNYNAQVEQYRRETAAAREVANNALNAANAAQTDINTLLPKADFSAENTVKKYIDDKTAEAKEAADAAQADIDTLLPKADFNADNTVKNYIDAKTDIELELYGIAHSLTAGSFAQSMIFVGNRLFAFGDGVSNAGVMCEISTLTGTIIAEYNDSRVGHPNGACVVDGYIYITNGDKTVYKINPDSLRIENGTSFSVDGPINNLFSVDDSIYAIVNQQSVVKLNVVTGAFENLYDIEKYDIPIQGALYVNGRIYVAYTQPNLVRVIDFATGNTLENKIIPDGDGAFPCNEVESLVYKDGKILVCTSSYINGGYNPQLIATAAFIFDSNIIGNISTHAALSKNIAFNNIFVNSSEASRFKPVSMNFTTALVASIVATYHGSGVIAITDVAPNDVMVLSFGKYSVWHYGSGETTLKALYLKNASATVENLTVSDVCTITDSNVTMTLVNIGGVVTIFNSMIHKNLGTFAPTNIAAFRHSIAQMDMQVNSDMESIVERVSAPNQNNVKFYIANNAGVPNIAFINYTNLTCFAYIQLVHEIPFIIKPADAATYVSTGELIVSTANATYPKIKFTRGANAMVSKSATPNVFDTAIDLTIMCTSELR